MTKRIDMTCRSDGGFVQLSHEFHEDCSWNAIAYQFLNFLRAQGYHPSEGAVGESVEDFVDCLQSSGEEYF